MDDLISRYAAIKAIVLMESKNKSDGFSDEYDIISRTKATIEISNLPSAQPERKKGIWIKTGQSFVFPEKFRNYSCSECGYDVDKTIFNYCPNCGADMRP